MNYLRVGLSRTGNFKNAKQGNAEKATRALYEVLKLGRLHNLSIKCQLDLLDKMVKPVLLYSCEIWGMGNNDILERVHLKFCKLLLNLKTSTPSYMVMVYLLDTFSIKAEKGITLNLQSIFQESNNLLFSAIVVIFLISSILIHFVL